MPYFRQFSRNNNTMPHFHQHQVKNSMPLITPRPYNTNTTAPPRFDDKAFVIKNVPTEFSQDEVRDHIMANPYDGVWACDANKTFNRGTQSMEIIPGQYFINLMTTMDAIRFRAIWSQRSFSGVPLRIEARKLRPDQLGSVASQRDINAFNKRVAEFDLRNLGEAPCSTAPVAACALSASAPAFSAAPPVPAAASQVVAPAPAAQIPASFHFTRPATRSWLHTPAPAPASTWPSHFPASSLAGGAAAQPPAQAQTLGGISAAVAQSYLWAAFFAASSPVVAPARRPSQNSQSSTTTAVWDSGYDSESESERPQFVLRRPKQWRSWHSVRDMEWVAVRGKDVIRRHERVWPPRRGEGLTEEDRVAIGRLRGERRRMQRRGAFGAVGEGRTEGSEGQGEESRGRYLGSGVLLEEERNVRVTRPVWEGYTGPSLVPSWEEWQKMRSY